MKEMNIEWQKKKTDVEFMERLRQKVQEKTTEDARSKLTDRQKKEAVKQVTNKITQLVSILSICMYAL